MTPKKLKGSETGEMNIEQIHQIIHKKIKTNIGHPGNPTSIWTYPFMIVYFWGGGGNLESWNGTFHCQVFQLFCLWMTSNALHTNITISRKYLPRHTTMPFGNYISWYECNPPKVDAPCHGFAFPTSSSQKITTVLLRIQIGPDVQLPFFHIFLQLLKVVSGSLGLDGIGLLQISWSQVERSWEKRHELSLKKEVQLVEKNFKTKGLLGSGKLARQSCWKNTPLKEMRYWNIGRALHHFQGRLRNTCWWKKSCTTCDVKNPEDNEIKYLPMNWCRISFISSIMLFPT